MRRIANSIFLLLILRYDLAFVRNDEAEMGRVAALAQETSRACRLVGLARSTNRYRAGKRRETQLCEGA
jgi:hypothetical protein